LRLCVGYAFCGNSADLWYKGRAWCGGCAKRRFGRVPFWVADMESRVPRDNPPGDAVGRGVGHPAGSGTAGHSPVNPSTPAPTPDEFLDTLSAKGWDMVDLEWALVDALEDL
jgi:hypothetical protein